MYTDAIAERICELVAERVPVAEICAMEGMPDKATLYRWKRKFPDFCANYTRAREERADARQDYVDELSMKMLAGLIDPAAARVAIDAEKWQMGKEKPKVYGERVGASFVITPLVAVAAQRALEIA